MQIHSEQNGLDVQLGNEGESQILCLMLHHSPANPHPCTPTSKLESLTIEIRSRKVSFSFSEDMFESDFKMSKPLLSCLVILIIPNHFSIISLNHLQKSHQPNSPIAFIGWRELRRKAPSAHLQSSDRKQRVNSNYAKRNCEAKDLSCRLGSIAEIICAFKRLQAAIQSHRSLNCEIRENPISRSKWTCITQQTFEQTQNPHFLP